MATNIPVGSALARKIYSVGLFTRVQHAPGFMNLLAGEMPKEGSFAAKAKGLKKMGLFIARPSGAPAATLQAIDNAIDYVVWRAPEHCRVSMENSAEQLTEEIIDWAASRAA